jgi:hypothetical protein
MKTIRTKSTKHPIKAQIPRGNSGMMKAVAVNLATEDIVENQWDNGKVDAASGFEYDRLRRWISDRKNSPDHGQRHSFQPCVLQDPV